MAETRQRSQFVDNCKAFLIFLVVYCHMLALQPSDGSAVWAGMYVAIHSFSMAAFLFISGMFAKPDGRRCAKSTIRLIVLYLIMACLVWIATVLDGKTPNLNPFTPPFSTWYLLALAFMFLMLPVFSNIRFIIPIALAFSLIAPCFSGFGTFLTLARFAYFLPFFLLGYAVGLQRVLSLRERIPKIGKLGIVVLALLLIGIAIYLNANGYLSAEALQAKSPYRSSGFGRKWIGMVTRVFMIVTAVAGAAAVILTFPDKKLPITYVGVNSLGIYILQAVITKLMPVKLPIDPFLLGWLYLPLALLVCLVFGAPVFSKILDWPAKTLANFLTSSKPKEAKTTTQETGSQSHETGSQPHEADPLPQDAGFQSHEAGSQPHKADSQSHETGSQPQEADPQPQEAGSQ